MIAAWVTPSVNLCPVPVESTVDERGSQRCVRQWCGGELSVLARGADGAAAGLGPTGEHRFGGPRSAAVRQAERSRLVHVDRGRVALFQRPGLLTGLTQWDGSMTPGSQRTASTPGPVAPADGTAGRAGGTQVAVHVQPVRPGVVGRRRQGAGRRHLRLTHGTPFPASLRRFVERIVATGNSRRCRCRGAPVRRRM